MTPIPPKNLRPNQKSTEDQIQRSVVADLTRRLQKIGVNMGNYQWKVDHVFHNPTGFYFYSADYKLLIDAAEETRKMELNFEGLPGHDLWDKQLVEHIGYVELDSAEPVGLDFAVKKPGECRAYYVPHSMKMRGEAFRQLQIKAANEKDVYREIARRLESCNPPIILDDHVGKIQRFGSTILDGVNFYARDYKKLKQTLLDAKDGGGGPFFAHAILENDDHWALKMSFLATDGTGFREISRLKVSDQPLIGGGALDRREFRNARRFSGAFTGGFPEPATMPDLSSLHCAVSFHGCNIHVDETGFVLADEQGNIVVDPDLVQHIFNELLFKTYGKYILPEGIVKRVNLVLPSTANDFNRIGVSVDAYKSKKFRISVSGTCSVFGPHECSGIITLSGRF
jgi:hypothetical protein